jgi:DNA-binding LacI/PurR family transcriptional regulator
MEGMLTLTVTIHDVAKKAGVSTATVSLIYNQTEHAKHLSEATRQRVRAVIAELGYQPNAGARSIRLKRYESIGVNFVGDSHSITPGQFYTHLLEGIENAVADGDYLCVLGRTRDASEDVPKFLRMRCVDGVLALHRLNESTYNAAVRAAIPLLMVNTRGPAGVLPQPAAAPEADRPALASLVAGMHQRTQPAAAPEADRPVLAYPRPGMLGTILYDDADAMTQVLEHLWAKGHRRVAYLCSSIGHDSHVNRLRAYLEWSSGHGLPSVVSPPWDIRPEGMANFFDWLRARLADSEPVTAIAVYNQHIFSEMMREQAFRQMGIPQMLSAVVCEFSPYSSFELDALKSAGMRYNPFEMGLMAGKAMIEHLVTGRPLEDQMIRAKWCEGNTVRSATTR